MFLYTERQEGLAKVAEDNQNAICWYVDRNKELQSRKQRTTMPEVKIPVPEVRNHKAKIKNHKARRKEPQCRKYRIKMPEI